jgi:hypothetical protein
LVSAAKTAEQKANSYIVEIEHIRPKNKTPLAALSSFVFGPNMLYF